MGGSKSAMPTNNTALKVGDPAESLVTSGMIQLEKIKVTTTYDVCNDTVEDFDDFKNFWVLEHKGDFGYHWLRKPLIGLNEVEDKNKPSPLPITLHSKDKFKFTALFKALLPITSLKIKIEDKAGKYTFQEQTITNKKKDEEFELPNPIESDNTPYQDTVQYFSNFELKFSYSSDGKMWFPLESAKFCLYLTWKEPLYSKFEMSSPIDQTNDMKILCTQSGKSNILETLLWLGCEKAKGKGNGSIVPEENEEQILDVIFGQFATKNVTRRREGSYKTRDWSTQGMGYWRGISAVDAQSTLPRASVQPRKFYDASTGTHIERSSRVILKYGEFRCGEWSDFLVYILMCQGIELKQFAIFSGRGIAQDYYYRLNSSGSVTHTNPDLFKKNSSGTIIENNYINWEFYVKGGWTYHDPSKPTLSPSTTYRAQGNNDPLHVFSDHIFVLFERSSKKWFDPSYGLKSLTNHSTDIDLLKEYTSTALDRIAYLDIFTSPGIYKTIGANLENHLVRMIRSNLFINPPTETYTPTGVISIIDSSGTTVQTF